MVMTDTWRDEAMRDQPPSSANRQVLVIDDDPAVLQSMLLVFREAGYEATGFADPLEALNWAADADPACVIVDLKLPGVEGLDLVSAFCALGKHAVILISAFVDVMTTVDAMRLGVDDVIVKPARPETVVAAVDRAQTALSMLSRAGAVTFTRRERQVAELIVAGRTTKQIAQYLNLSPRTVEFFRASLLKKTSSPNTAALASALTRLGIANG